MRVACLVSGGKDSILAAQIARDSGWEIDSFLTLLPEAAAPLLFHRPNAKWVELQARAAGVPWFTERAENDADEMPALKRLLSRLKGVHGIVAGALASEYQRTRFERIAHELGLKTFAPLWHHQPAQHVRDVIHAGLRVRFVHVAAEGLDSSWLGRELDNAAAAELERLATVKRIHVAGEGGEYESFVEDAPLFAQRIEITRNHTEKSRDHGTFFIDEAKLVPKKYQ